MLNRKSLIVSAAMGFGALASYAVFAQYEANRTQVDPATVRQAESLSRAFRQASEVVLPTVVKIHSSTEAKRVRRSREPQNHPLAPFLDLEGFGLEEYQPPSSGTGSGVIIDRKGLVLTNNHVVDGADKITVVLQDGREFEAFDVRRDPKTDLAILRIKADRNLEFARLGDSDSLEIGDWVLAIGNPFEFESSVSAGIISAKGRSLGAAERATFLQTDAAINPGNSGGPLVNLRGEVVGINTAIASKTGAFNGIGFAIPINLAKWISSQLANGGEVNRAWLGVGIRPVSRQVRKALGLDDQTRGVLVSEIRYGAPSEAGGIQPGDVITTVAGKSVNSSPELQRLVEMSPLGSIVPMTVFRNGQTKKLNIKTEALPNEKPVRIPHIQTNGAEQYKVEDLGIRLFPLTPTLVDQLGLKNARGGFLITAATREISALGVQPGAVLYQIGDKEIRTPEDLDDALNSQIRGNAWRIYCEVPQHSSRMILVETTGE